MRPTCRQRRTDPVSPSGDGHGRRAFPDAIYRDDSEELRTRSAGQRSGTDCTPNPQLTSTMLRWTFLFLIIAVIAGIFGFTGIAGSATEIAKVLFFVFLVLLIISAIVSAFKGRPPV